MSANGPRELRMVLVFRADLPTMTRAKSEIQAAHAAFETGVALALEDPDLARAYLSTGQMKLNREVDDEAALRAVEAKAASRGVRRLLIVDEGRTCFDGPTATCLIMGPMSSTDSNAITRRTRMRDPVEETASAADG